jgi:membrane fusion protein, multidrug efflux system
VTIGVPEEVSRRIGPGQSATVRFDALPGREFTGVIERIEPGADPQSRQFTARVRVDNSQGRLRPGTFAKVTLVTQKETNVLVVPREAVTIPRDPKEQPTVTVVAAQGEGQVAQVRPVRTGLSDGKAIAIEEGIQDGEQVVIMAGRTLKDGQTIKLGGQQEGGGDRAGGKGRENSAEGGGNAPPGSPSAAPAPQGGQTR